MAKKLPLRWSWNIKRLRIYMNWIWPTGMRVMKR